MELSRRTFAALLLGGAASLGLAGRAVAESDPLPSWNAGPAKDAIVKFVHATTDAASSDFVPAAERIATFDQDGTLWVEHPLYTQIVFAFSRVPEVVKERPELAKEEAFRAILSGDREAIGRLSEDQLLSVVGATLTGMDVETYRNQVETWIKKARDPRWNRPFTELVYQPQIELLQYLRANGYRTFIVTGGGQDFVRAYAESVYGVPPEQVIGTMFGLNFKPGADGKPVLVREAKVLLTNDGAGKPEGIHLDDRPQTAVRLRQLGRRPRDARICDGGRRRPSGHDRPARRRRARIRLRAGAGSAGFENRNIPPVALRPGDEGRLDRGQHEERLEADLRV